MEEHSAETHLWVQSSLSHDMPGEKTDRLLNFIMIISEFTKHFLIVNSHFSKIACIQDSLREE